MNKIIFLAVTLLSFSSFAGDKGTYMCLVNDDTFIAKNTAITGIPVSDLNADKTILTIKFDDTPTGTVTIAVHSCVQE